MDILLHPKNRFTWSLLALQGGYVNIAGLLSVHFFVSHITGFSTHFSLELVDANFLRAFYLILVPFFFLAGAFFSSLFTEVRKEKNKTPIYIHILLCMSLLFLSVALLGWAQYFGKFGEPLQNVRDFILLCLLAFSCGAQNAIFTSYSKSVIRTTHLTGIATDLGIGLAKAFISKDLKEQTINRIRIELIISFTLGGVIGAFIMPKMEFLGFLIPAFISLVIGLRLFMTKTKLVRKETVI